ncbi:MAG: glycosyl hydrolase, partial [Bacteroidaceae bacterium]|nr:glycosyl hydrolase [Bacteroidaceae bacterium]
MKKLFSLILGLSITVTAMAQVYLDKNAPIEDRVEDALKQMTVNEKIDLFHACGKFTSLGVPRLGIRHLNHSDGPHGCRAEMDWNTWNSANWKNDAIVAFPSLSCLAATWNPLLSSLMGEKLSEEFAYRNKDLLLGPGVNIVRTPLCGRNFEYMGEDP